jgi:hypothetical protein
MIQMSQLQPEQGWVSMAHLLSGGRDSGYPGILGSEGVRLTLKQHKEEIGLRQKMRRNPPQRSESPIHFSFQSCVIQSVIQTPVFGLGAWFK